MQPGLVLSAFSSRLRSACRSPQRRGLYRALSGSAGRFFGVVCSVGLRRSQSFSPRLLADRQAAELRNSAPQGTVPFVKKVYRGIPFLQKDKNLAGTFSTTIKVVGGDHDELQGLARW